MSSAPEHQTLTDLSKAIADSARTIDEFFNATGLPPLSFDVDAPMQFPVDQKHTEIHAARRAAMDAAKKLHDLLWGPQERSLAQLTPVSN